MAQGSPKSSWASRLFKGFVLLFVFVPITIGATLAVAAGVAASHGVLTPEAGGFDATPDTGVGDQMTQNSQAAARTVEPSITHAAAVKRPEFGMGL